MDSGPSPRSVKRGYAIADKQRLFMVPGMLHCGGGDGTSTFDMLSAIEQWVENGKAPVTIAASKMENGNRRKTT